VLELTGAAGPRIGQWIEIHLMDANVELVDDLYLDKVRQARAMSPEQRFLAGPEMFDLACEFAKAGIRMRHPDADEARVLELLRERLAIAERLEAAS